MIRSMRQQLGRAMALPLLFSISLTTAGCDGSGGTVSRGVPGAAKLLKDEDFYKWEGEGKAKKKVSMDRKERLQKLREAGQKTGTE